MREHRAQLLEQRSKLGLGKLPQVSFHTLRHTTVSLLVAGGLDVYQISRRIGHSSASLTLKTYSHLFRSKETEAAEAIDAALRN